MSIGTRNATVTDRPQPEELYARAEALVPILRDRASLAEELRRLPDETIADFEASGLLAIVTPLHLGGYGYGLRELGNVLRILAQGCTSSAWIYHFIAIYTLQIAQDLPAFLDERPYIKAAMSGGVGLVPCGTALPVEGGWRVSGTWPYASGILHSDYVLFVTTEPAAEPDGEPTVFGLVGDVSDATVLDDWHVSGMVATGSNSFTYDDVFIPAEREWPVPWGTKQPKPAAPGEGGRAPFSLLNLYGILFAGDAVGAAEGALADFKERIRTRKLPLRAGWQRDSAVAWERFGRAHTEVRVARMLYDANLDRIAELLELGIEATPAEAAIRRMTTARTIEAAADAVDIIVRMSGSSVFQVDNPLQRQLRDITTIRSHALAGGDSAFFVSGGRTLLDLDS